MNLSVTLELEDEICISRGDVISAASYPIEISDQFEADIVWMSRQAGHSGRTYSLKLAGQNVTATLASLKYQVDVNTGQQLASTALNLNEIARVTLNTQRPICFDDYGTTPQLGAFILIDNQTNDTVAAGMVRFALRRATNIHWQQIDIDKKARRALSEHTSKVFWLTGLSGSGKSTIANEFANELHARGIRTYILDGDNIRHGLNKDLGFTDADRVENIRRTAEVAKLMVDAGIVVLTALISPFRAERDMARSLFEEDEFVEVFVDTPIKICEQLDVKGLYKKVRAGEIPNFTGIGSPYEDVPLIMSNFDVAIIPFKITPLTKAVNPVKIYEYSAAGKAVVSTALPEVELIKGIDILIARTNEEFLKCLRKSILQSNDIERATKLKKWAQEQDWSNRVNKFIDILSKKSL